MKKFLSFVTVFALSMSLYVANAQDKPKTATKSKVKSECCTSAKTSASKADACCADKAGVKASKVSKKSGDACCSGSAAKTKKMAAKHECGDKCGDDCKMAHQMSKNNKN